MLARRFTVFCLIVALFGMMFAILVAQTSRPAHAAGSVEIEAPAPAKKGVGLFILVSLQRA